MKIAPKTNIFVGSTLEPVFHFISTLEPDFYFISTLECFQVVLMILSPRIVKLT